MLLLVGLGNPGPKYEQNRHNIGFMAVDEIVRRHSFTAHKAKFQGLIADGSIDGNKALVLKPTTFMNDSGQSVGEAMRFYKLTPADVIVFHDELDLAFGKLRVRTGGGLAGHNGLRSINQHIGPDFGRVRIGIGHPGDKDRVHGHVLSDFSKAEREDATQMVEAIGEAAPLLVAGDEGAFMSKVALTLNPPEHNPKPAPANQNRDEES
ncbi:MAG: aminoacyl-tRNA hydrolase [Rhodospirillaceae bacterium]|nr:aminoacyl-tRNA hydrolase [Rhodospirillaceae bacterium]